MLPSRSSTPRPRPVASNSSSLAAYQEEYASSGESSWTTPAKTRGEDVSCAEINIEVQPRKRRRVSTGSVATTANPTTNKPTRSQPLLETSHSAHRNLSKVSNLNTRSHGLCQTCRKCESSIFCARCEIATCSICARTCTLAAVSTPPTPLLCFSITPSPRPSSSQLPTDLSSDSFDEIDADDLRARLAITSRTPPNNKRRSTSTSPSRESEDGDGDGSSRWLEGLPSGCSRVVCQACAVEDSDSHESTCLDCLDGFGCPSSPTSSPSDSHLPYEAKSI